VRFDSRDLALTAVSAGLYAAINIVQTSMGGPITYGPIQLRLADCLIPLSALLRWPLILGVSIGCFSNAYYWLDPADIVIGPLVNLVAAFVVFALRKRQFGACLSGGLSVGVPIGFYLYYLHTQGNPAMQQAPNIFGFSLPVWCAFVISLSMSSLIVVTGIGYLLLATLSRRSIVDPLKARGLKTAE